MTTVPRGIRNNNPGNLNFVGQAGATKEPGPNGRFAVFKTPREGLAALRRQLVLYMKRDKIDTVHGIISKWAPPIENDTNSYINYVAKSVGVQAKEQLGPPTPELLLKLMKAIIYFENGQDPYGDLVREVAYDDPNAPSPPSNHTGLTDLIKSGEDIYTAVTGKSASKFDKIMHCISEIASGALPFIQKRVSFDLTKIVTGAAGILGGIALVLKGLFKKN